MRRKTIRKLGRGGVAATVIALGVALVPSSAQGSSVLVDQMSQQSGSGADSNVYRTLMAVNAAADDFVVPAGSRWQISQVDVAGSFLGGVSSRPGVTVVVLRNDGGLPGNQIAANVGRTPNPGQGTGSFSVPVSLPALGAGRYWIAVLASTSFPLVTGYDPAPWHWRGRRVVHGYPAAYRAFNVQDLTGYWYLDFLGAPDTPCEGWRIRSERCGGDSASPDQAFRLLGTPTTG